MATIPTCLPEPLLLANLPLPPDEAEELERYCRSSRYTGSDRRAVEEEFKLSHFYAGHFVIATASAHGLEIHAVDLEGPDEVNELAKRLRVQGHRYVHCLFPTPRNDPHVSIVTLNPQS